MIRLISRLVFWAIVVGVLVYGYQNGWFSFFQKMFGAVVSDVKYQQSQINYEEENEEDNGIITITKTKRARRAGSVEALKYGRQ